MNAQLDRPQIRGRLTRAMWLAAAVLIPGGIVVLALLAVVRLAGRRALTKPDGSRRAA